MRAITATQRRVALLLGANLSYQQAADTLGVSRDTIRAHVFATAQRLPNPHGLPQKRLVTAWAIKHLKKAS